MTAANLPANLRELGVTLSVPMLGHYADEVQTLLDALDAAKKGQGSWAYS